ncbi:BRO1-like domain-containing protein [Phycomyces nitens]|nr:BRO1-like domain-containing protein [Phycomyces nitens]
MATSQIPFTSAPFKRTEDIDWIYPLKRYISQVYQDDPEKYNEETFTINRLRQDTRGAGKDITGRDLLYRYFGQLELLDLRFPVDEKHVKVIFTWYDAFSGRHTAQYSLAYEKASIIFNIAATLSAIAACQNRAESEGRKRAFNFFQAAAGMFQYINDNFLHAPSLDLSRETVKMLKELMLAQAHECFLENSLREKKKEGLIAKLASHAAWTYGSLIDLLHDAVTRGVAVDKAWIQVCQIKQKYYQAMAHLHKATACEAESKYGEQVARLSAAEVAAKEATKLAAGLSSLLSSSNHANGTLPADSATSLQELSKTLVATCSEKHGAAMRDNDMIYHDTVPQESILVPIDRLNAVKPVPIAELYGPNEVNKVIGTDIFSRLVPLSVHESASLYSEEKAQLVRSETERCDLARGELSVTLDYMKLPGALDKFKQTGKVDADKEGALFDGLLEPTAEVREWAKLIAFEESSEKTSIGELVETLDGLKSQARKMLDEASIGLDQEMRDCENMRMQFGDEWTQQPSGSLTSAFRQDLRNHRESLEIGSQSDAQLMRRYEVISKDIGILRQGEKSQDLVNAFTESIAGLFESSPPSGGDKSLLDLDIDVGIGKKSMETKVKRVEDILDKLRKIEKERDETLNDLKEKTIQDDISHLLILNKKVANVEQQIFASELEKFQSHQQRIAQTIHKQQQVIQELTTAFKLLMEGEDAQKLQSRWDLADRQRRGVVERFSRAKTGYFDTKEGLSKGIQFYNSLGDTVETLLHNCQTFIQERKRERDNLASTLESTKSAREQELLKEKINKYSGMGPTAPVGTDDSLGRLTEQTRQMSLGHSSPYSPSYSGSVVSSPPMPNSQYLPGQTYTPSSNPPLAYSAPYGYGNAPARPPTTPYNHYPNQDAPPSSFSYQRPAPPTPHQNTPSVASPSAGPYHTQTPHQPSYSQPQMPNIPQARPPGTLPFGSPIAPAHPGYNQPSSTVAYRGPMQPPPPGHPPPPLPTQPSAQTPGVGGYYPNDPSRPPHQPQYTGAQYQYQRQPNTQQFGMNNNGGWAPQNPQPHPHPQYQVPGHPQQPYQRPLQPYWNPSDPNNAPRPAPPAPAPPPPGNNGGSLLD